MASAVPALEEFDPTSEICNDNSVNSCELEASQYRTPYARDPKTNHYKLHISDLPQELDEDGIEDVFKRYGTPLGILVVRVKRFAFVSFATIREAQLAIQNLNNQPPLYMKVRFSKNNERPSQNQFPHPMPRPAHNAYIPPADHFNREEAYTPRFPNTGRGRDLAELATSGMGPRRPCSYNDNADVLYPAIRDPTYFDAYEDEGPHYETNTMFARRSVSVIRDGSRYVTLGRGYTVFEIPPPNPNINEQIKSVYEKRRSGLYEYGENKLADQIGKCTNCAKPATHRCKQCRVNFYCNRECQMVDWATHKYHCVPMPELEVAENLSSMTLSSNEEQAQPTSQLEKPAQLRRPLKNQSPIRRNVNTTPHLTLPQKSAADFNSAVPHKNCDNFLEEPQVPKINGTKVDGPKIDHQVSKIDPVVPKTDDRVNRPHQNNSTPTTDQSRDPKAGPTTPIQNRLENARQQQQRYRSSSPIEDRQTNQHRQPDFRGPRPHKFNNGRFNHMPNQSAPNGCRDEEKSNEACPQTENQSAQNGGNDKKQGNDKSQRNHMRNQGRISNCNDKLAARSTAQLQDPHLDFQLPKLPTSTVETKLPHRSSTPDPLGPMTTSSKRTDATGHTTSDPVSATESLVVDDVGCFEVHVPLGNNKFGITICTEKICEAYEQIVTNLTIDCEKLPSDPNFKPNVGDLICGKREDHWIRGNVVSVGPPIQLSVIDEGRIEAVDDVRAIPQKYISLPLLGATCEVISEELKLERMQKYEFCVTQIPNPGKKCVEAYVKSENMAGRVLLSSWSPTPEQRRLKLATLTSGASVVLSSYVHQNLMYVRSCLATDSENFHRLIQDVTKCALTAPPITRPPVDGELVLCKYSQDENFYRGIVRHIANNKFKVTYVDFGNSEETSIDKMRHMPEQLKEYPSAVARISLTGVPTVPMNADVATYLAILTGTEEPLTISFNGATLKDGVTLKTSQGMNVNEKLIELLKPTWKKDEPEDLTVYTLEMLEIADLGPLNTLIQVIPLCKEGDDIYMMAPRDPELCSHIQDVMSAQIQEYCTQTQQHYIPRENEMCLAPFEGVWYRAVCLQPNVTSSTSQLMFVDYGNSAMVDNKDIRVMTKDFMTTKALASICQIQGLTDDLKSGQMSPAVIARLEQLVPLMSLVTIKILNNPDLGTYTIELPEVRATLVKEGLIKS